MNADIEKAARQISVKPVDWKAVAYRGRRNAAWRVSVLALSSVILTVALIAGGIGARALVHDDAKEDRHAPGPPRALKAEAVGPRSVLIGWIASIDDIGVTEYEIHRNENVIDTVDGSVLTYEDNGVQPEQSYRYRVFALDAAGNRSEPSRTARVTTPSDPDEPGGDDQPPSTPELRAHRTGPGTVMLEWTPSEDNVGVAGYIIFRGGGELATVVADSQTYLDEAADSGTTHVYQVQALDGSGNASDLSNEATIPEDDEAPGAPTNVVAAQAAGGGARITWDASPDNVGIDHYIVRRDNEELGTTEQTVFDDTASLCEGTYTYFVVAVDHAQNRSDAGTDDLSVVC